MPITDFDSVWERPGDIPSQIDVFNKDSIANRLQDQAEYLQKLSEGLSAADRHKLGNGTPEELEIDLSKEAEKQEDEFPEPEARNVEENKKNKAPGRRSKKR